MSGPEDPSRLKGVEMSTIQVLGGIAWQRAPAARQNTMIKEGDAWYVSGVERVETEGTAGWRHLELDLFLQGDSSWGRKAQYFPTEEAAQNALEKAIGTTAVPSTHEPTAFELAMQKAQDAKKGAKK